ncbi:unnamed protein product [Mucor hiemalis]
MSEKASQQDMAKSRIPLEYRDYCAKLLIPSTNVEVKLSIFLGSVRTNAMHMKSVNMMISSVV